MNNFINMRLTRTLFASGALIATLLIACVLFITGQPALAESQSEAALAGASSPNGTLDCLHDWQVVPVPNAGNNSNELTSVVSFSPSDSWAVGFQSSAGSPDLPVTEHWNGTGWSIAEAPPITESGHLQSVDGTAPSDLWAVGYTQDSGGTSSLIMHWNGTAWSLVPAPLRGRYPYDEQLTGVVAISPTNAWAVGIYYNRSSARYNSLILHWNGTVWSVATYPAGNAYNNSNLTSVDAVAANDVWAVGHTQSAGHWHSLTMHFDGSNWSIVSSPDSSGDDTYLNSVSATPGGVWAVGGGTRSVGGETFTTYAMRWNGTAWSGLLGVPNPSPTTDRLDSVVVLSASNVWAAGPSDQGSLILHYDGSSWSTYVGVGGSNAYPNALAATSTGELWAVGGRAGFNLALHYPDGGCITPGVTNTPAASYTPTGTPVILPSVTPTASPTYACALNWYSVGVPRTSNSNKLEEVRPIAGKRTDVWAVGRGTPKRHWDGSTWSLIPGNAAAGIDGVASDDVWAVDTIDSTGSGYRTRIEHWNGSQWTTVLSPNPDPGNFYNFLMDVDAVSSADAWAVGYYGHSYRTMVVHWNGQSWQQVTTPNYGGTSNITNELEGVYAIATDNVWAAGHYWDSSNSRSGPVLLHWDGSGWSVNATLPVSSTLQGLYDIQGSGPADIWAVGDGVASGGASRAVTLHWDGSMWTDVPNPLAGHLSGVTAISPTDAWAVGSRRNSDIWQEPVMLHWNGATWSEATFVMPPYNVGELNGIANTGADNIWTVGFSGINASGSTTRPMVEHYFNYCEPVAGCQTRFTDMPLSNAFYRYAICLTCNSIVSGYPCGGPGEPCDPAGNPYFRPNSPVSRGQIAKIVALAAQLPTAPGRMFEDVAPGSTFYPYVQSLAAPGYIGGYPCGTVPSEPCGSGNLPYFRPGATTTRGQLCKIVSNSAGYQDDPGAEQFTDVPVGSTFFLWINRLARRSILSGYACGGPSEPCAASNLPYFRPNNPVSRGQTTKIAGNAFVPSCNYRPTGSKP